ncbi:MAG: putative immunity protein [Phycisphaerae bacterium]
MAARRRGRHDGPPRRGSTTASAPCIGTAATSRIRSAASRCHGAARTGTPTVVGRAAYPYGRGCATARCRDHVGGYAVCGRRHRLRARPGAVRQRPDVQRRDASPRPTHRRRRQRTGQHVRRLARRLRRIDHARV